MKTIVEVEEWENALAGWKGGKVVVWMYHATYRRMALRLMSEGMLDDLYVIATGCSWIEGALSWEAVDLKILRIGVVDGATTTGVLIQDEKAGFRLRCSDVGLARGPVGDYDVNFDGFLGDESDG